MKRLFSLCPPITQRVHLILFSSLLILASFSSNAKNIQEIDHIVAIVNDDVVTYSELSKQTRLIKQRIAQRNVNLPPDDVLQKQILEQLIVERLQIQTAKRTGIRVDDESVNKVITNIAAENNMDLNQFREILIQDGFTFEEFREKIRREIMINQLRKSQVQNKVTVSESEIDNFLASLVTQKDSNNELHLAHILVALPTAAASPAQIEATRKKAETILTDIQLGADFTQTAIAKSQGQHALDGGDLGWRKNNELPKVLSLATANMQKGEISGLLRSPNGFHIIQLIDRRSDTTRNVVQQTLARHILLRPNAILSSEEARQRLVNLRERIIGGEDFAQLARANSKDTASATNGGSLGWSRPGKMVPKFERVMDSLKPGEISQPFQTQFGWHIVQVMSRREHDNTLDSQREKARQQIGKRKSEEAIETMLRQLRSDAYVEIRLNQ
jgi:peptidyl-prolyl cis-trans isomerase SurA